MTFAPGGLTVSPSFLAEYYQTNPNAISDIPPFNAPFLGEDGVYYYLSDGRAGTGGGAGSFYVHSYATGAVVATLTGTTARADAIAGGVVPSAGWLGTGGSLDVSFNIPGTPYIVGFFATGFGVTIRRGILYYKVDSGGSVVFVGGYAGGNDGLGQQFNPQNDAVVGGGFILNFGVSGVNNDAQFKYPFAVAFYRGTAFDPMLSSVIVIPSINEVLANTPLVDAVSWASKIDSVGGAGFGDSIFYTTDLPGALPQHSRLFALPRSDGSAALSMMFYRADLEAYDAGTEAVANTFLSTYAPTYPTGLVSTLDISLSADGSLAYGFAASLGSLTTAINSTFLTDGGAAAFPFPDDTENYDGSAGTAANNFYGNPSLYPSDAADPTAPWLVFFPRFYRNGTDRDKIGLRIFEWDPINETLRLLDFGKDQVFTLGVDVSSNTSCYAAAVLWEESTGNIKMLLRSTEFGARAYITLDYGTFAPIPQVDVAGGAPEAFKLRGWAFELDGHEFYVLRLGQVGTYIYDRMTQQWSQWLTGSDVNWNAAGGRNWNNYVVAGALEDPYLWSISPEVSVDDGGVNDLTVTRTVTGLYSVRGRDRVKCPAVRITASVGAPDIPAATIQLRFSDDYGTTFSSPLTINMSATDTYQSLDFRSLGAMRAPGRVFEVTDMGGATRIDDAVIEEG